MILKLSTKKPQHILFTKIPESPEKKYFNTHRPTKDRVWICVGGGLVGCEARLGKKSELLEGGSNQPRCPNSGCLESWQLGSKAG
jgi:hypothetical protein